MARTLILKSIKLKNFKGVKEFMTKVNLVTNIKGTNASGKTTIADAVSWILFGKDSMGNAPGKTFVIQPLDKNGDTIHNLETEVNAIFSLDGVEMLFVSASWPLERKEHLLTLSRARAIENEIYLVLSSSAGNREDIDFCGCSSIFSPTGELLATQDNQEEGIVEACFDEKEVYLARTNLPVFKDRKPNLYK